jgi:hypothetical protein
MFLTEFRNVEDEDDDENENDSPFPRLRLVKILPVRRSFRAKVGCAGFCGLNEAKRKSKRICLGGKNTKVCWAIRRFR